MSFHSMNGLPTSMPIRPASKSAKGQSVCSKLLSTIHSHFSSFAILSASVMASPCRVSCICPTVPISLFHAGEGSLRLVPLFHRIHAWPVDLLPLFRCHFWRVAAVGSVIHVGQVIFKFLGFHF